jgi:hypothetical protein
VTGIARRPFPDATDRRFAVTPRFPADVRVAGGTAPGTAKDAIAAGKDSAGGMNGTDPGSSTDAYGSGAEDVDLVGLDSKVGRLVRVGGLVVELRPDGFTLDDGTGIGRVVVRGPALEELPLIEPEDALNAIGHVEATADGAIVAVDDPAGLIQAGDPIPADASASPAADLADAPVASSSASGAGARLAGLGGTLPLDPGAAGLGTLLAISAASLAVTLLRRGQARRRMAARIARRLATFAGSPPDPVGRDPG